MTPGLARHVEWIAFRLASGSSLSRAVASLDVTFTEQDAALLRAGEATGEASRTAVTWARLHRARSRRAAALRSLAAIPLLTIAATAFAVACSSAIWNDLPADDLLAYRAAIEADAGSERPPLSLAVPVGNAVRQGAPVLTLAAALVALPLLAAMIFPERLPALRRLVDRLELALPWWGSVVVSETRWTLFEILRAGAGTALTPPDAFDAAARTCHNVHLREELGGAALALRRGGTISEVQDGRVLDAATRAALVRVAHRADARDALGTLGHRAARATDRHARRLVELGPAMLTLVLGAAVGCLATGFFVFMFDVLACIP